MTVFLPHSYIFEDRLIQKICHRFQNLYLRSLSSVQKNNVSILVDKRDIKSVSAWVNSNDRSESDVWMYVLVFLKKMKVRGGFKPWDPLDLLLNVKLMSVDNKTYVVTLSISRICWLSLSEMLIVIGVGLREYIHRGECTYVYVSICICTVF